jgi:hypothetical protein
VSNPPSVLPFSSACSAMASAQSSKPSSSLIIYSIL